MRYSSSPVATSKHFTFLVLVARTTLRWSGEMSVTAISDQKCVLPPSNTSRLTVALPLALKLVVPLIVRLNGATDCATAKVQSSLFLLVVVVLALLFLNH
jgi:hypothetical protein